MGVGCSMRTTVVRAALVAAVAGGLATSAGSPALGRTAEPGDQRQTDRGPEDAGQAVVPAGDCFDEKPTRRGPVRRPRLGHSGDDVIIATGTVLRPRRRRQGLLEHRCPRHAGDDMIAVQRLRQGRSRPRWSRRRHLVSRVQHPPAGRRAGPALRVPRGRHDPRPGRRREHAWGGQGDDTIRLSRGVDQASGGRGTTSSTAAQAPTSSAASRATTSSGASRATTRSSGVRASTRASAAPATTTASTSPRRTPAEAPQRPRRRATRTLSRPPRRASVGADPSGVHSVTSTVPSRRHGVTVTS